jgi:hypothetical protein
MRLKKVSEYVHEFIKLKLPVLPLVARSKKPAVTGGVHIAPRKARK